MREKRSVVSEERLKLIRQPQAIYIISGSGEDINKRGHGRGFFSLFIQAIYGISFANKLGIPYFIDFGEGKYLYTDSTRNDLNFWNYYFQQKITKLPDDAVKIYDIPTETYPIRVWAKSHFTQLNKTAVSDLKLQREVQLIFSLKKQFFSKYKVLGVQIRLTDHSSEVPPVPFKKYIKEIDKRIKNYDKLFVATDDEQVISKLQERYGTGILIYNDVVRSIDGQAVHHNKTIVNKYSLGLDVLVDCYCLSLCQHMLAVHSNISYAALLFTPNLSYTLLEQFDTKVQRLKTQLVYYLDYYKLRRW